MTAARDQKARIWDSITNRQTPILLEHSGPVLSARFSPDGTRVVTTSEDKYARVWDSVTGKPVTPPLPHSNAVNSAEFSADGRWIVTVLSDKQAQVWDARTGRSLTPPLVHDGLRQASFHPDGTKVFTVSWNGNTRKWDSKTGKELLPQLNPSSLGLARISPDGNQALIASWNTARVLEAESGQPLTTSLAHSRKIVAAEFSSDQRHLLITLEDYAVYLWDVRSAAMLNEPYVHGGWVHTVDFSSDGSRIVTACGDGVVRVLDAQSGKLVSPQIRVGNKELRAKFNSDATRVVTVSEDGSGHVWDAATGAPILPFLQPTGVVNSIQLSPDGTRIVTASSNYTARIWAVATGQPIGKPLKHEDNVVGAEFSSDGKLVLTGSWDNTARLWNAETGEPLSKPMKHDWRLTSAHFSPDGMRIVTGSWDSKVRLWKVPTCELLTEPLLHPQWVTKVSFSPDGKRLLSQCGRAFIWDAQNGRLLLALNQEAVHEACFSPNNAFVATAGDDHTTSVWDIESGQPLARPFRQRWNSWARTFSPDSSRLAVLSNEKLWIWDVAPTQESLPDWLLELAEAIGGLRLSEDDSLEPTSLERAKAVSKIRQQLAAFSEADQWTQWGSWFLADRSTRTISPFSKIAMAEYIEKRIQMNTPESLDEAEQLSVGKDEFLKQITQARILKYLNKAAEPRPQWRSADAEPSYRQALSLQKKYFGNVSVEVAATLDHLASMHRTLGDTNNQTEAEFAYRELLDIKKQLLGDKHPDLAVPLLGLAASLESLGKLTYAESAFRELFNLQMKNWPHDLTKLEQGVLPLAGFLKKLGRVADVEEVFAVVLTSERKHQPRAAGLLRWRGDFRARYQQWNGAADDLGLAMKMDPTNDWNWYALAPLLIQTGDLKGFAKLRDEMLIRPFQNTNDAWATRAIDTCLLMPISTNDLTLRSNLIHAIVVTATNANSITNNTFSARIRRTTQAMAGGALGLRLLNETGPASGSFKLPGAPWVGLPVPTLFSLPRAAAPWTYPFSSDFAVALDAFRRGALEDAEDLLRTIIAASAKADRKLLVEAQAQLVLAMTQAELGRREPAQQSLTRGIAVLRSIESELGNDLGSAWIDYLMAQILLQEAKAKIQ